MKTLEQLTAPVSEDSPAGEDMDESLEFDSLRSAFEMNFPIDAKVQQPDPDAPDLPPVDWGDKLDEIEGLTEKTRDLYLAVSYARCGFPLADPDVVRHGLEFTAELLESHWDALHPAMEFGFGRRSGICEELAGRGAFALPFLELPLIREGRMALSCDQVREAHEVGAGSPYYADVMRALDPMDDADKLEIDAQLGAFLDLIDRIRAALATHADGDIPDFSTTRDTIEMVRIAWSALAGLVVEAADSEVDDSGEGAAIQGAVGASAFGGAVRSRDDVIRALTAVEQYYAVAEPGHPVKVAVARLRGWVNKDFMQILEDIVPHSVDDAKNVLLERRDME